MRNKLLAYAMVMLAGSTAFSAQAEKRGFDGDAVDTADLKAASKFDWYYNLGQQPAAGVAGNAEDYAEYVPMAWGSNYDRQALIDS